MTLCDNSETASIRREDVKIMLCSNIEADEIFLENYWLKRKRRSRRISYSVCYHGKQVAWIQCADPFGTKLAKPIDQFSINDAIELCRGYFIDCAPDNIESCAIAKVLRNIPNDWFNLFGVIKKIAIIYQDLDAGQKAIVYKALGFKNFGNCTRSRHYLHPARGDSNGHKILWARALRPVTGQHYKVNL
ncbi:MAG TPA: hypothetical protein VKF38_02125 [Anaerolineaceae bacterium]|nr:hypothetical protein [Anaerolineaceae bacterium]